MREPYSPYRRGGVIVVLGEPHLNNAFSFTLESREAQKSDIAAVINHLKRYSMNHARGA